MLDIDRQSLIDCGLVKQVNNARYKSYRDNDRSLLCELEDNVGFEVVDVCKKVINAQCYRVKRCKVKIAGIVFDGLAYFLTLTFEDSVLANTTPQTRRRYVARMLKKYCAKYVANIDFGKENGREHYHAIVELDDFEGLKKAWANKCGFIDLRKVGVDDKDLKKTAKYINKLNAHCFKDTTHMHRVIYSRKTK